MKTELSEENLKSMAKVLIDILLEQLDLEQEKNQLKNNLADS